MVTEKARALAALHGIENFDCSSAWLWRFKQRNGISSLVISGETNEVDEAEINKWLDKFVADFRTYSPRDVFSLDVTGVFFNLLPDRTLDFNGTKCHGGSKSTERLTVVLCCNADGSEKLKPWVIGKSRNPKCFNMVTLPRTYSNHKSAWIDAKAFRERLIKFDRRMASGGRHELSTLDNCSAHNVADLTLPHVRTGSFPPNSTSRSQPLDQGIIANVKRNNRSELVRDVIQSIENHDKKPKWIVLQAIRAIESAPSKVTQDTIVNCFRKAWSASTEPLAPTDATQNTSEPERREWSLVAPPGCSFDDYVNVYREATVSKATDSEDVTEDLQDAKDDLSSESETEDPADKKGGIPGITCNAAVRRHK